MSNFEIFFIQLLHSHKEEDHRDTDAKESVSQTKVR